VFITPTKPAPLGLDLDSLHGGGSCPSQFEGMTADGRLIHIRYRGGQLSVRLDDADEPLLDVRIGPPLHGDMALEQACDLAGLTIRGEAQTLTDDQLRLRMRDQRLLDLSGRETYWDQDVRLSRRDIGDIQEMIESRFIEAAAAHVDVDDERAVLKPGHMSFSTQKFGNIIILLGVDRPSYELAVGKPADKVDLRRLCAAEVDAHFHEFPEKSWCMHERDVAWTAGRPIEIAAGMEGGFNGAMATGDAVSEGCLRRFVAALEERVVSRVDVFDLITGDLVERGAQIGRWYGRELEAWCRKAPDRFLDVFSRGGERRSFVGVLPSDAPRASNG